MQRLQELMRYSVENVLRARVRTMLTIAGIGIASGALVSMVAFVLGLKEQAETPIQKLGLLNNIEVRPAAHQPTDPSDPQAPATVLDDAMITRIEALDGVEYAYPDLRLSQVELSSDDKKFKTYAIGMPREATLLGFFSDLLIAGEFFSLDAGAEIILGEKSSEELGFATAQDAIGQQIELTAAGLMPRQGAQFEFEHAESSVQIVGVYRPPGFATNLGADAVLLPVDMMRDLPGTRFERNLHRLRSQQNGPANEYAEVVVRVAKPIDVYRVQQEIQALGLQAESMMDRFQDMRRFFVFMEILLSSVGTVALVVAGLGILNTLLMTVMERYQEIGIYKAFGASTTDIRVMFLTEAGIVGLAGGLCGLVLAWVVSWLLQWAANTYAQQQGVEGPMAVFRFPLWLLAAAVAYSVVISLVSGWYPASRAAKVDPIQALRGQ